MFSQYARKFNIKIFVLLVICNLFSLRSSFAEQLIINSSFEKGFEGWNKKLLKGTGESTLVDDFAYDGNTSCQIKSSKNGRYVLTTSDLSVEGDKIYKISFYYRTSADNSQGYSSVRPMFFDENGRLLCYACEIGLADSDGKWEIKEFFIKTHSLTSKCKIEFNILGHEIWFDDVRFESKISKTNGMIHGHVPIIEKPICSELFSQEKRDPNWYVFPNWAYNLSSSTYQESALKFGYEYIW